MSFLARLAIDGRSVLVSGSGPIAKAVAVQALQLGGQVFLADPEDGDVSPILDALAKAGCGPAGFGWPEHPVDGLVNVFGSIDVGAFEEVSPGAWNEVQRRTLRAAFNASRRAMPAMAGRRSGAIVNVASDTGSPGSDACLLGARAAMVGLTRALAREGAPLNVRANAVCRGSPGRLLAEDGSANPATAQAVADAVAYLLSDAAAYVTGETLTVGGRSAPAASQGDVA